MAQHNLGRREQRKRLIFELALLRRIARKVHVLALLASLVLTGIAFVALKGIS